MNYAWKFTSKDTFSVPGRQRASFPEIQDELFWSLYDRCAPFSMAHITGFLNVYQSMKYIKANAIRGDLIECGCHMGGMGIVIALLAKELKLRRRIVLFDTFCGFPPGQEDTLVWDTVSIQGLRYESFLDDVRDNLEHVLGARHGVELIEGDVETTIPTSTIEKIALLRLDTDFFESTKAELHHFYPRLSRRGVLTIDDYGVFQGSRRATDEYFAGLANPPLLNRIDSAVWSGTKP